MEIAIGLVLFWLTLAVWFAIQAVFDARSEARRQRFLDKWEE